MTNTFIYNTIAHYSSENPGVKQNLIKLLTHGSLALTGKMLIYSIDQGFEIGPDETFSEFSHGYDPWFHFKLACAGKVSAISAPLGVLESSVDNFLGKVPMILKLNSNNRLAPDDRYYQAITASVDDALRLGCVGIGFTIYPGSEDAHNMFEEIASIIAEAKAKGLLTMIWAYPKGPDISKEEETSIDLVGYAVHIASLLGAHLIKAKMPSENIWNEKISEKFEKVNLRSPISRIQHIQKCAFAKKRMVLFSGGERASDENFLESIENLAKAGALGSVIGRNFFQRSFQDGLSLIENVANIYKAHGHTKREKKYED